MEVENNVTNLNVNPVQQVKLINVYHMEAVSGAMKLDAKQVP